MIIEEMISNKYKVRKLITSDIDAIYDLCHKNSFYYDFHPPMVTHESIIEDMEALPPNKTMDDKYFIGFWDDNHLVAVMDLILSYPSVDYAFIGFFIIDIQMQGKGTGSNIITECLSYLKKNGFSKIRLGVDKGNPQSLHFWHKNGFEIDQSYKGDYIAMERII